MRIIYATSDLPSWINVAQNMQNIKNWDPIYWITTPKNELVVQKTFPNAVCQGYIDAIRGEYTHIKYMQEHIVLDQNILEQYASYEKTAIKMMDRMDPTAYAFNITERTQLYYEFLQYWLNVIKILRPDGVLFTESPHGLFQYILYVVCIENNIKIIRYVPTHISGLTFLSSHIEHTPVYLENAYERYLHSNENREFQLSNKYLEKNRNSYNEAIPYYMKTLTKKDSIFQTFKVHTGKIKRFLKMNRVTAYKKGNAYALSQESTKFDLIIYKIKGFFVKRKLQKAYDNFAISADLTKPYIYVALHYQPEKTSSPEAGVFVDQWLMVNMLASSILDDWTIYVKEHSSQFSNKLYGEQGRRSDFYEKVRALRNVQLINSDTNSFDLIDNAKAIATLTGTVGLESVIRSKPVLCFGHAWYEKCHGVMKVTTCKDLKKYLEDIEKNYKVESYKVDAFLHAIESVSFPAYLNPGNKAGVAFDEEENIHNLTSCLLQYADRV